MTRRGYTVVGVDLSDAQQAREREGAAALNLTIAFQKHDARSQYLN
jgi:hypothetical protein